MGRLKSGDKGERRTAFIGAYLTPYERAEVERRAELASLRLSDFVRLSLLSKRPGADLKPRLSNEVGRQIAVELARVGNNINQLARIANSTHAMVEHEALNGLIEQVIRATEKLITL